MSALSDRIRGIVRPSGGPHSADAATTTTTATTTNLKSEINLKSELCNLKSPDLSALGGEWRDGCFLVEREWKASSRHGREAIGSLAATMQSAIDEAPLFAGGSDARPPFLFFDLETTGLNGGAGTHVFLVGCGWFDDGGRFVTRQYVLTRFTDERPLLATVAREIDRAGALVSFNGKSFDAPLLETRYSFHRLEWLGDALPHVDVLHPARQFWRGRPLAAAASRRADIDLMGRHECSLVSLERQLLGHRRAGDVSGFEIPARYFQFVRSGNAAPLASVLEHNRLDLLSLAALTARLLGLARLGPEGTRDAREALALGRVYARADLDARAIAAFERAVALSRAPAGAYDAVTIESLRALALAYRRARRFDAAAECWQRLLDTRGCPDSFAREASEALAIHHEHRRRDLAAARSFALKNLEQVERDAHPRWTQAVQHRLSRLERKLETQKLLLGF